MNVFNIELRFEYGDKPIQLYPCVIEQEGSRYLVDCGYEHSLSQISSQLTNHGLDIQDIDGIILTHDDIDHLGGLFEIRQSIPIH